MTPPKMLRVTLMATAAMFMAPLITAAAPANEDAGIVLPPGFRATIFADHVGHARHMVLAPDGTMYVNTWSGKYYDGDTPAAGGFLVALKDTTGNGQADKIARFGPTSAQGNHGGTGIALYDGKLYAETNDKIVRYDIDPNSLTPKAKPVTIVSGLPLTGDHPMHPIAIDKKGALFVDLGSATNACQEQNRVQLSPGIKPCSELETRGGIWRYDAGKTDQKFSATERFATGLRNGEGISFDNNGRIYATQHGRDQLFENWPDLYTPDQGHENPAEELVQLEPGADFGWPECYFDIEQRKLVLAPEYGGDGGRKIGVCADKAEPVAFFPGHYAPDGLKIYEGSAFPKAYQGGAFIAFHGSWNRAPAPQGGYNIVFQPLADGRAAGKWVVFADGFAQGKKEPASAPHRPVGVAVGPKGALYVSDDIGGRIWRITYDGDKAVPVQAAPGSKGPGAGQSADVLPPEGLHPNAGRDPSGVGKP